MPRNGTQTDGVTALSPAINRELGGPGYAEDAPSPPLMLQLASALAALLKKDRAQRRPFGESAAALDDEREVVPDDGDDALDPNPLPLPPSGSPPSPKGSLS